MRDRELVSLLNSLTQQEHRDLRRAIQSHYFCGNEAARKVLTHLSQKVSAARAVPVSISILFQSLRIKTKDPEHYFDNLQPVMKDAVLDFLAMERLRGNPVAWSSERALALAEHEASTVDSVTRERKGSELGDDQPATSMEYHDHQYMLNRLRRTAEAINTHHVNGTPVTLKGVEELLAFAEATRATRNRKIKFYFDLIRLMQTADRGLWKKLTAKLVYVKRVFAPEESHEAFMMMLNVAIRFVNEGSRAEYLGLAKALDEMEMLAFRGRIQHPRFVNTALTAIQDGQYDWAAGFIKRYRSRLSGERALEVYSEVMAMWHFYQHWKCGAVGALDEAHCCLNEASELMKKDVLDTYNARKILTMIYVEKGDGRAARSLVESTIRTINNNQLKLGQKHSPLLRFFRIVQAYLDLPFSAPDVAAEMAVAELEQTKAQPWFASKDWLFEKFQAVSDRLPVPLVI